MRYILTSMVLAVLLFPALALGETVKWKDLVKLDGLLYKKFTDVPFSGEVTGKAVAFFRREAPLTLRGRVKDGKKDGLWVRYWRTGNLRSKGTYKNGKKIGPWVHYYDNGKLSSKGTFKNGKKDGPWVGYEPDGKLDSKGTYKDGEKIK